MSSAPTPLLILHPADNVGVAVSGLAAGTRLDGLDGPVLVAIPPGHKVALRPMARGTPVIKCGQPMGIARVPIDAGAHAHVHNIAELPDDIAWQGLPPAAMADPVDGTLPDRFLGYSRPGGQVGTRNFIGILTTVNCSATVARRIAAAFSAPGALAEFPHVDGVVAFTHPTGCAMDRASEGYAVLERVIRGYLDHPNFGAVLLVGLGCEVNQGARYARMGDDGRPFEFFDIQGSGGTTATIEDGIRRVRALLPGVNRIQRAPLPLSGIKVGLQCGGSDAFSVISANPALGHAVDRLVGAGATAILSETPEVASGAALLRRRCRDAGVAALLDARFAWWRNYTARHGTSMEMNPAPGNVAGGISTLAEKALGAIAKGGSGTVVEVREYAEPVAGPGLVFMDSPGFDPVSATGQIAAGANVICFTTGRGSTFGSVPAPCLKLASNTAMFERMADDMDVNCGTIVDGATDPVALGTEIARRIVAVASGDRTRSELLGLGENEFAPWIMGAVL